MQGRLKAVLQLLFLGYVDRYCGFRSLVCAFAVCAEEEKQVQKQKLRGCLCSSEAIWLCSRADDAATNSCDSVSTKSTFTSPAVMFNARLVLPSAMTWTEKSACVANLPRSHEHTRARFLLLLLWCCCPCVRKN